MIGGVSCPKLSAAIEWAMVVPRCTVHRLSRFLRCRRAGPAR